MSDVTQLIMPGLQRAERAGAPSVWLPELRLIYDTAPIGLAFLSPDCRYLHVNQRLTQICGISVEDHIGRSVRETVPKVADQVEKIVEIILSKGEPITDIEVHGQRSDGTNVQRLWLTSWHPQRDPEGTIFGINVVAEEITERKSTEAALAASEARYRALVRASSSLVWTTAADGQIVDMPEWRALTGQTIDEVRGWGWLDALHPDDRARTRVIWQAAVDKRSIYETEYRIRRRDGEYVWHQARGVAVLEDDGSIREWVGICVDTEDRKRAAQQQMEAEKALRDLNETLEQRVEAEARERARIWNVSQDMLVVADMEGRILNVNPAWTATLGWSEADLIGNTSEWLLHPDDHQMRRAELARLAGGRATMQFENRLRHKRGTYCWLSWTAAPDGGFIYAVARDVTEIKNAEEQLRASRRELAKVSGQTMMGAMTASIAHEVNQPLTGISMRASAALRWMRADKPDFQKVADALEHIVAASHRTADVVAGIRSMFKKDSAQRLPTDINGLIVTVLSIVRIELEQCKVDVQTHLDEQLPIVQGDKVQLQQVVLNLVTNAIDAMQLVHWPALNVRTQANAGKVIVSIEDTGTGIDPSKLDQIFKPLFTSKANGMGMGLAICQSIIESHDGRIWASPAATRGSIFQFELPTSLDKANMAT